MATGPVQLENLDSIPLAVIRKRAARAELAKVVPECCGLVWNAVKAQQTPAGRHVAIYWDSEINVDIGVELKGTFAERDAVVHSATPAGRAVFVTHFGPYHTLAEAHDTIRRWCSANGHRLAGPTWEIYGHWQDEWNANPTLIRTDVFYQIAD